MINTILRQLELLFSLCPCYWIQLCTNTYTYTDVTGGWRGETQDRTERMGHVGNNPKINKFTMLESLFSRVT